MTDEPCLGGSFNFQDVWVFFSSVAHSQGRQTYTYSDLGVSEGRGLWGCSEFSVDVYTSLVVRGAVLT